MPEIVFIAFTTILSFSFLFLAQSTVESFLAAPTLARFSGLGDEKAALFLKHIEVRNSAVSFSRVSRF